VSRDFIGAACSRSRLRYLTSARAALCLRPQAHGSSLPPAAVAAAERELALRAERDMHRAVSPWGGARPQPLDRAPYPLPDPVPTPRLPVPALLPACPRRLGACGRSRIPVTLPLTAIPLVLWLCSGAGGPVDGGDAVAQRRHGPGRGHQQGRGRVVTAGAGAGGGSAIDACRAARQRARRTAELACRPQSCLRSSNRLCLLS
jgi:hypothetical protein